MRSVKLKADVQQTSVQAKLEHTLNLDLLLLFILIPLKQRRQDVGCHTSTRGEDVVGRGERIPNHYFI